MVKDLVKNLLAKATRNQNEPIAGIGLLHPASLLGTVFGIGRIPFAPGTWGALIGILIPYPLLKFIIGFYGHSNITFASKPVLIYSTFALVQVLLLIAGAKAADIYMKKTGVFDPGSIVIDEVLGSMVTFSIAIWIIDLLVRFLPQYFAATRASSYGWIITSPLFYAAMFIFFRIFDIWKPGIIGWADRNIKGGFGVMLDDILAGIFAGITTHIFLIGYYFIFHPNG